MRNTYVFDPSTTLQPLRSVFMPRAVTVVEESATKESAALFRIWARHAHLEHSHYNIHETINERASIKAQIEAHKNNDGTVEVYVFGMGCDGGYYRYDSTIEATLMAFEKYENECAYDAEGPFTCGVVKAVQH